MSSSKVFRVDNHFTPTPLVQRTLAMPVKTAPMEAAPSAVAQALDQVAPEPTLQAKTPVVEPIAAPPEPPPAPEPAIDLEVVRQEAYNRGAADQAAQFQATLELTVSAFGEACRKIDNQRRQMLDHSQGDLINLVIALTEKILGQELVTPRNIIANTLQAALEQAIGSEEHYVTLHPDDLAVAEAKAPELIAAIRGLERIVFKTDPLMSRGGCMLESAACTVDASIEGQLAGVRDLLEEHPGLLPTADVELPPPEEPPAGDSAAGA